MQGMRRNRSAFVERRSAHAVFFLESAHGAADRREVIGDATLPVPDLSRRAADVCVSRERAHEYLRCRQGVTGAPYRVECPVFVREPGADDEWSDVRRRGQLLTRYPMIAAS